MKFRIKRQAGHPDDPQWFMGINEFTYPRWSSRKSDALLIDETEIVHRMQQLAHHDPAAMIALDKP